MASKKKNSLWFQIKAKFYSMQQKLHRGFDARASTSVESMRRALYQESYLSGLLHMEKANVHTLNNQNMIFNKGDEQLSW